MWRAQVVHLLEDLKVNKETLALVVQMKLKGAAATWYNTNKMFLRSLDAVLKEMTAIFARSDNLLVTRRRFEKRSWSYEESFANYFNEKCLLSSGLNVVDTELVEYIIDGIPDKQLQVQAKLQNFPTASSLVKAFRTIELPQRSSPRPSEDRVRCYNCNSYGHLSRECRKAKRELGTCFACGEKGHYASRCSKYKKSPPANNFNA
ncbi:uncharacterized protein LOC118757169 isoform X1 [Rhagoletis pomonella]|uniref:uncharacterized protein LOC118757169 isoform X1 n=1 Tax=Rhagoletis pomonella TaxID=28610 RepID=UPI001784ED91|nr:uncharacterized protein LOC118757169 isoform X1 [Rhagoletis pomonella]